MFYGGLKKPVMRSSLTQTSLELVSRHSQTLWASPLPRTRVWWGSAVFHTRPAMNTEAVLMGASVIINRWTRELSALRNVLLFILSLNRPNENKINIKKMNSTLVQEKVKVIEDYLVAMTFNQVSYRDRGHKGNIPPSLLWKVPKICVCLWQKLSTLCLEVSGKLNEVPPWRPRKEKGVCIA